MATSTRDPKLETTAYTAVVVVLALFQLFGVFRGLGPGGRVLLFHSQFLPHEFGFSQLRHLGPYLTLLWFAALTIFLVWLHRHQNVALSVVRFFDQAISDPRTAALLSFAAFWIFYSLSNEFVNADGRNFQAAFNFQGTFPGAGLTHDEIWEIFLHRKFWAWSNQLIGWNAIESYHFLSSLAGGFFIFLLIQVSRLLFSDHPSLMFLAVVSGGFMQLFFGDVENYTLTAVMILLYIYAVLLHIQGKLPLLVPAAALAVANTFHLLSMFLLPSLIYVSILTLRKGGRQTLLHAVAAYLGIIVLTIIGFHFIGLPIQDLYYHTHAFGHGGDIASNIAPPSLSLYLQHANLWLLLSPAIVLIPPLLLFRRIPVDTINLFLGIAAGALIVFQLFWKSGIGVYNDWNLYAASAIPLSLLVWRNFLQNVQMPLKTEIYASFVALTGMHSLVWIVWNHYFPYG